jgi:hypothetical protein
MGVGVMKMKCRVASMMVPEAAEVNCTGWWELWWGSRDSGLRPAGHVWSGQGKQCSLVYVL